MLGIALGCIRISYDDFCRLSYDEFAAVYEAYVHQRDFAYKSDWERIRLLACITIQPHINPKKSKNLTPQRLLPFPWDKERPKKNNGPKLTPEQQRQRFENIVKKLGDKI